MSDTLYTHSLDTKGLACPEPVMLLHGAIRDAQKGDVIRVLATDPSTQRDIPKFCQFLGHILIDKHIDQVFHETMEENKYTTLYTYYIEKG